MTWWAGRPKMWLMSHSDGRAAFPRTLECHEGAGILDVCVVGQMATWPAPRLPFIITGTGQAPSSLPLSHRAAGRAQPKLNRRCAGAAEASSTDLDALELALVPPCSPPPFRRRAHRPRRARPRQRRRGRARRCSSCSSRRSVKFRFCHQTSTVMNTPMLTRASSLFSPLMHLPHRRPRRPPRPLTTTTPSTALATVCLLLRPHPHPRHALPARSQPGRPPLPLFCPTRLRAYQ